jgi:hypothetical protein
MSIFFLSAYAARHLRSPINREWGMEFVAYANNELDADKDIAIVSW